MTHADDAASWMRQVPRGALDPRVLLQDRCWVTAEATVLPLAAASRPHLVAILDFLHARAVPLHMAAMVDAVFDLLEAAAIGQVTAEQITYDLTGQSIASVSADAWLESTPLVRAIRRELAARQ